MAKPIALVLYEAAVMATPADYRCKYAANTLGAMGFDVRYLNCDGTNPTVAMVNSMTAAVVVIATYTSVNRANLSRFVDGTVTKPVFVLGCGNFHSTTKGVSATPVDSAADYHTAQFSLDTTKYLYDNTRRYQEDTTLVAPAAFQSLIESTSQDGSSVSEVTPIVAWRYTADGDNFVYYTASEARYTHLPYLVERAIADGVLSSTGIRKIPMFLNIDHINDFGDQVGHLGGFQTFPDKIAVLGNILRRHPGAVCYTNLEQTCMDDVVGTTEGTLLANLIEYSDVFKYIACHSHSSGADTNLEYTTGSTPWTDTYTKTQLLSKYNTVKALIEGLGLTVNTDFAHHAGNRFSRNWIRIAGRHTSYDSSDDGATEQAGLGFKFIRADVRTVSNPYLFIQLTSSESPITHWRVQPQVANGMICVPNRDAGNGNVNTDGTAAKVAQTKFNLYGYGLEQLSDGIVPYFHGTEFEDEVSGTISDGKKYSYSVEVWDAWSQLAQMCPHTVDFGADANNYAITL